MGFYHVRIIVLRLLRLVIVNASFVCFKPEFRRISRAINKPQDETTLSLANEMSILTRIFGFDVGFSFWNFEWIETPK